MRGDGALDEVRFLVVRGQPLEHLGVLDALRLLLLTEGIAGTALRVASAIAVALVLVLAFDPQRLGAGLTAARAQVGLVGLERTPQVTLEVVEFVDPVAPGPAVRAADA